MSFYVEGIIVPLTVVAILFISTGIYLNLRNQNRITGYQNVYAENAEQFIQIEKARTEEFIKWYPVTKYFMAGLILIGLYSLLFMASPNGKGVGIGLILLGFSIIFWIVFQKKGPWCIWCITSISSNG